MYGTTNGYQFVRLVCALVYPKMRGRETLGSSCSAYGRDSVYWIESPAIFSGASGAGSGRSRR